MIRTTVRYILTIIGATLALQSVHAFNKSELLDRAKGKTVTKSDLTFKHHLWPYGMDLSCWNGCGGAIGSQNHPPVAHAAIGDYQWIAELCRVEKKEGLFGRELGSNASYMAFVSTAKMVALKDARAAGAIGDAKIIEESLLATWAYISLTAVPAPKKDVWVNAAGGIVLESGNADTYNGLTVAHAGERWIGGDGRSGDGSDKPAKYNSSEWGYFLGWVIDWKPRSDGGANLRASGDWWHNIIAHLVGKDFYAQTAAPAHFGITSAQRQQLLKVVQGDYAAAEWAISVIEPFGVFVGHPGNPGSAYRFRLKRTSVGAETIFFNSGNGNKPAQAATQIYEATGEWKSMRPGYFKLGANKGFEVWIDKGIIYADVAPGEGEQVSMPEMGGTVMWQVDFRGKTIRITQNAPDQCEKTNSCTNNAGFVSQKVPTMMAPGDTGTVSISLVNTGTSTWKTIGNDRHKLGSENPESNNIWGIARVDLPFEIFPGDTTTIVFPIIAPTTIGSYNFQWKMLQEQVEWFGELTPNRVINVYPKGSPVTDIEIVSLLEPIRSTCKMPVRPSLFILNNGPNDLGSLKLNYQIDSGSVYTKDISFGIALKTGAVTSISLEDTTLSTGKLQIKVWTSAPNGTIDTDPLNDTILESVTLSQNGLLLPFTENFESLKPGKIPNQWTNLNYDSKEEWFVFEGNGNKAMAFNNFVSSGASNEEDDIILPLLDLSADTTAYLAFDVCHAERPGALDPDELEVMVSTDCGHTFTSVWKKSGKDLSTVAEDSTLFIPSGVHDYRTETVDLKQFTTSNQVLAKFINRSNNGNSTLIDNINISPQIPTGISTSKSEDKLHVYPNPAQGYVNLNIPGFSESVDIAIFDFRGAKVLSQNYKLTGNRYLTVPLDNFKNGVYLIKILDLNGRTYSDKLLILR